MKPTRIMTNAQSLTSLGRTCTCTLPHEILCGFCKFRESGRVRSVKTSISGQYPPALCRAFARALLQEAPPGALCGPGEPELSPQGLGREARTCRRRRAPGLRGFAALPQAVCYWLGTRHRLRDGRWLRATPRRSRSPAGRAVCSPRRLGAWRGRARVSARTARSATTSSNVGACPTRPRWSTPSTSPSSSTSQARGCILASRPITSTPPGQVRH